MLQVNQFQFLWSQISCYHWQQCYSLCLVVSYFPTDSKYLLYNELYYVLLNLDFVCNLSCSGGLIFRMHCVSL